jgi:hypothetical protein
MTCSDESERVCGFPPQIMRKFAHPGPAAGPNLQLLPGGSFGMRIALSNGEAQLWVKIIILRRRQLSFATSI